MQVKYPLIVVPKTDSQFVMATRVRRALEKAGHSDESMRYFNRAMNAHSPEELMKLSQEMVTIV